MEELKMIDPLAKTSVLKDAKGKSVRGIFIKFNKFKPKVNEMLENSTC